MLSLFLPVYSASGFAVSLAQIEVGIAYACWAALGTAIVSTAGIVFFGESCDSIKLVCLLMIMAGVVGLNLRDSH
jgi:multidrug transporter EmrE-like cation transporter